MYLLKNLSKLTLNKRDKQIIHLNQIQIINLVIKFLF